MASSTKRMARLQVEALEARAMPAITLAAGVLTIQGTGNADDAFIRISGSQIVARMTYGTTVEQQSFAAASVASYLFLGGVGNDRFVNESAVPGDARGQSGHDYLEGGSARDIQRGAAGNDTLVGSGGDDRLVGGIDVDYQFGLAGNDLLLGKAGDDFLYGGVGADGFNDTEGSNFTDQDGDGNLATLSNGKRRTQLDNYVHTSLLFIETEVIRLTNLERTSRGLAPLATNAKLVEASQHHALNMARYEKMQHTITEADLADMVDRINFYQYNWSAIAENIAWNYADANAVVAAWMASAGHRANILNPAYTEIGVGVRYDDDGQPYYCQNFGSQ